MCNPDYVLFMAFNNDRKIDQLLSSNLSLSHSNTHTNILGHKDDNNSFFFSFSIDTTITRTMALPFIFIFFFCLHSNQISILNKKENLYIIYIHK